MYKKNKLKAIVAIAVALAFILPTSAAFANLDTIGITPDSENTSDTENIVEIFTNNNEVTTSNTIARNPFGQYMYYDDGEDSGWYYESGMTEWDTEMILVVDMDTYVDGGNTKVLPTTGVTIYVGSGPGNDSTTIQGGIDLANPAGGDTVYVYNGIYYEKVVISKQLNLVGESRENVIVNWSGLGTGAIYIAMNDVSIDGFTITAGITGIYIEGASDSSISNCNVCNCYIDKSVGMHAMDSPNTNITNCDVYNNLKGGISLAGNTGCPNSNIIDCNVYDNDGRGIYVGHSPDVSIVNCNVYRNSASGITIAGTSENGVVTDNEVYENGKHGISLQYSGYTESNYYLRNNIIQDVLYSYDGINVEGVAGNPITWHNDIDTSNTIDGKLVYYLSEIENEVFNFASMDVGYLVLADCTNVTVKNAVVDGGLQGMLIVAETTDSLVMDCTFSGGYAGIRICGGSYNNEVINCNVFNTAWGIRVKNTYPTPEDGNKIMNCNIYNNSMFGFWTQCSRGTSIIGCDIYDNGFAYTQEVEGQTWWPFSLQNGGVGVMIHYLSTYNTVENCTIHGNYDGIVVFGATNNNQTIRNNELYNNIDFGTVKSQSSGHGIAITATANQYGTGHIIDNCSSHDNRYGIYVSCDESIMRDNSMNDNNYSFGLGLYYIYTLGLYNSIDIDPSNTINGKPMFHVIENSDIVFDESNNIGWLWLDSCTNITVENIDIEGILLTFTNDSTISGVTAHNSMRGIDLAHSPGNTVVNCEAYNNAECGIVLTSSSNCSVIESTIHDNALTMQGYGCKMPPSGVFVRDDIYEVSENFILEDCEVYNHFPDFTCGFPLKWTGLGVHIRASNNIINNNVLHDNVLDLHIAFCSDNIVTNNTMEKGIILEGAGLELWLHTIDTTNMVNGKPVCYIKHQVGGGVPPGSGQLILINCTQMIIENQIWDGVSIGITVGGFSKYNTIRNCELYNNEYGIFINHHTMIDNTLYHNTFVNNEHNAYDIYYSGGNNQWDNGYPSGGNYWDDYTGVDDYSGPDQNIPGSDGIGDTAFTIPQDGEDRYPLMYPLVDTILPTITNVDATPVIQEPGEPVNIVCTVTDNIMVDTVTVKITTPSSTDEFTMTNVPGIDDYYYDAVYSEIGTYDYFIWANDTIGNDATSDMHHFVISEDAIPPEISDVTMTATSDPLDTDAPYGWENVSCTVTDNMAVDEVKLVVTDPNAVTTEYPMTKSGDTYYYNTTFTIEGCYDYHIWADDTSDNEATSSTEQFEIPANEDVNLDGWIHFMDLVAIVIMYGDEGSNGWIREDVDNDGVAHFMDLVAIVIRYDEHWDQC